MNERRQSCASRFRTCSSSNSPDAEGRTCQAPSARSSPTITPRLDALLRRAASDLAVIDRDAYEQFRAGLLRHIAMEEKVLLPEARRRRRGEHLPIAKQLRADHAALAALLVPTPTHAIVTAIREILDGHNQLEEGPAGVYETCEDLAGAEVDALLGRLQASPEVPVAPHFDGPRVHEHIANLLRARANTGA